MKILGMLIVGTGEADRYLPRVLKRLSNVCDEILVACNAKDAKTRDLVAQKTIAYDFSGYEWGKKQNIIKEIFISKCIAPRNPDWVVCVDADEIISDNFTREKAEEMANRKEIAYEFYCVQLWDREDQMRVDGPWGNFWNVRYFKFIKGADLSYQNTPLHCGLAPKYAYAWRTQGECLFKHYGYMKKEDRMRKVERYAKYDPSSKYRSSEYYNGILSDKPKLKSFDEKRFRQKLQYVSREPSENKIKRIKAMAKIYYIRNKWGKVYSVNEDQIENHRRKGIEIISEAEITRTKKEEPKRIVKIEDNIEKEEKKVFNCPICGKEYKTKAGLTRHKKIHK